MIPDRLKRALEAGTAILFIGAGIGHNMKNSKGEMLPDGYNLAKKIVEKFKVPAEDDYNLAKITQYVVSKNNNKENLTYFIKEILSEIEPDDYMKWIPTVRWKAIFTTNYDNGVEKSYDNCKNPVQDYYVVTHGIGFNENALKSEVPIIHLHGYLYDKPNPNIIITQQDYIKYNKNRKLLFAELSRNIASNVILYIGYSHNDANWNLIQSDVEEEFYPHKTPLSYRVDPFVSKMDEEILSNRNITTIKTTFKEFVEEAISQISIYDGNQKLDSIFKKNLSELMNEIYDTYPIPLKRLINSWDYVNELQNIGNNADVKNFVRGNQADWNIIFSEKYFKRDIEDEIFEKLLDFATNPKNKIRICSVCGSAGYGVSTLLMALAKKLIEEEVGKVFYLKSGKDLVEGDVEFVQSIFPNEKIFLFIDNASDFSDTIKKIAKHAKEKRQSFNIVIGDRTNELNQAQLKITNDIFYVNPLSDSEIEKLIDFLGENAELNKIEFLSREHQVALFKQSFTRQLLVSIREITEGRSFDSIIQDEYFNIEDELCRRAYAITSCFTQSGSLIRVELLSKLLNLSLSEYYKKTNGLLEGVIFHETLNETEGLYAARTRHSIISKIIWDQCLATNDKDVIIHEIIDSLNIAYRSDKIAFESFIRNDAFIDSLSSLQSKIQFFDKACNLNPDNPYVKQHYSRMLTREKHYRLALKMIDDAIEQECNVRMLYHTKGYVLHKYAIDTKSIEVARKYYGQSEDSFKHALKINCRDDYSYHGLAYLYLDWSDKCNDENERNVTLAKCDELISTGLEKAYRKELIWVCLSGLEEHLGNSIKKIESLKKAVEESPTNIRIKLMLATAYRINKDYDDCIPIFEEIICDNPTDYRVAIEYARVLLVKNESINKVITILSQCTRYGLRDARFVTMLGGLQFLAKDFSNSENTFEQGMIRAENTNTVFFSPEKFNLKSEYDAKVHYVGAGFSRLYINKLREAFCPGSKYNGIILKEGMNVKVKLEFNLRGAIAQIISKE